MTDLQVGAKAPEFNFSPVAATSGETLSVKGFPFVVFFYPRADSSACTNEVMSFSERLPAFSALGVRVVGISPDAPAKLARFREKHGVTVDLVSDSEHAIINRWGVWVEKSMYGRSFMGVERATFLVNSTGKIVQMWRKVRVPGHADAVLAAAGGLAGPTARKGGKTGERPGTHAKR
jgi:peroxiredoxin Q/BCP